jgi:hypothetical protein
MKADLRTKVLQQVRPLAAGGAGTLLSVRVGHLECRFEC